MRILLLAGLCSAAAQAQAVYDTSIVKNGNVWIYARDEERRAAGTVVDGFTGTTRFEIFGRTVQGDTLRFQVIRRDSLRSKIMVRTAEDTSFHFVNTLTRDTAQYAFHGTALLTAPPPFFLVEQHFTSSDARVVYRGDTVRSRGVDTVPKPSYCSYLLWLNLEGLGRVSQTESRIQCGQTSGHDIWTLTSFNGVDYAQGDVIPVALRAIRAARGESPRNLLRLRQGRVVYGDATRAMDLRGKSLPRNARPVDR